ncbi:hypothetical protein C9J60_38315 [Streptomyces sp. A244]|uniref:hypothetical protein n=1 Tax=Streptomyces sp. A244 TaxID=2137016 RepID=UPI000D19B0DD|nr:hypothetical protein [Streptomyces sp. A244]PTH83330.1 hypothetical protein C9J60_38315 [Streptomyces sp. A244]
MLPPSAIAGVSLVCALGPWVFTEPMVLRGLAAAAAATAVIGAVVLRRWDTQAGKRVADLTRARASDEWRFEERVAELEADLEESRELRAKLEQRLRSKRTELAGLRNEHAALLRRYATAEADRASVLEDRRMLEIEATAPVRAALPAGAPDTAPDADGTSAASAVEEEPAVPAVFSPEGSRLFLRAAAALARFDGETVPDPDGGGDGDGDGVPKDEDAEPAPEQEQPKPEQPAQEQAEQREQAPEDEAQRQSETDDGHERTTAETSAPGGGTAVPAGGSDRLPEPARAGQPAGRRSGHYTVPTAVAVPPQSPVRRPQAGGGFDFFGTKAGTSRAALEAVQNEDLADVVGQEALALHKAETEARYKPADEESRGIGQVIDLTAHDETEQIDVQGLRSAVS